jgi:hypothetical protein
VAADEGKKAPMSNRDCVRQAYAIIQRRTEELAASPGRLVKLVDFPPLAPMGHPEGIVQGWYLEAATLFERLAALLEASVNGTLTSDDALAKAEVVIDERIHRLRPHVHVLIALPAGDPGVLAQLNEYCVVAQHLVQELGEVLAGCRCSNDG